MNRITERVLLAAARHQNPLALGRVILILAVAVLALLLAPAAVLAGPDGSGP